MNTHAKTIAAAVMAVIVGLSVSAHAQNQIFNQQTEDDRYIVMDMLCASRYVYTNVTQAKSLIAQGKAPACQMLDKSYEPRIFVVNQMDLLRTVDYEFGVYVKAKLERYFNIGLLTLTEHICSDPLKNQRHLDAQLNIWRTFLLDYMADLNRFYKSKFRSQPPVQDCGR